MAHRVSSPAYPGDKPPLRENYLAKDEAWRQWAWLTAGTMPKTVEGLIAATRVSVHWSLAMSRLIDDLVAVFSDDPDDRSREHRKAYRGIFTPGRRLNAPMIWRLYLWMRNWVETEGRLPHHEIENSRKAFGIPDPAARVIDFLLLVHFRLERTPFASEPEVMSFGARRAHLGLRRSGLGRRC